MAEFVVLLVIVLLLAGAGGALLVRRRRPLGPATAASALARAAAAAAAGQHQRAGRRYARVAARLADAPAELRPQRGAALVGQAEAATARGDEAATHALYREAFPLLADPVRELPRWALRRLAEECVRQPDGALEPPLALLRATAAGAEPGAEAEAAARVLDWYRWNCREAPATRRDRATQLAVTALPGHDWPVLARAALLRERDDRAGAEALLAHAAPHGSGELSFRLGALHYADRRDPQAVAAFDEALRRGPGEPSPWARGPLLRAECLLFRGLARQRLGDTGTAWADLHAAATEAPGDPRPPYALGRLALLLGADDRAGEQFTAALAARPDFAPARLGLALVHERAGRPADAARDYRDALTRTPDWRPARIRLGAALLAAGRTEEAEPLLRDEADPDSRWGRIAAFHHGLALARSDNPAGALDRWEPLRADDLLDRLALARDRLARRRLAADPAAARELWQRAVADAPAVPGYRAALREAALREAAHLLLAGRDRPQDRDRAAAALALAAAPGPDGALPGAGPDATLAAGPVGRAPEREARLRAALALAGDTADPLAGPAAAAGPRDRYHLAAATLLTGRAVQTVALLAAPEADRPDPGTARLRALLAERAGNWPAALDWHRLSLATGPAPQAPPGADCAFCARPAEAGCGGCGREGCAAHLHRPAGAPSPRCERCAGPALRAVLDCARRAGVPEQAEPVLAHWAGALGDSPAGLPLRRDLALLRAELGLLDEALEQLPDTAGRERGAVLVRRAGAALAAGDAVRAAGDLREAVRLAPAHPGVTAALVLLAEHEARGHALAGRYRQAWDGYRGLLLADPVNPRLLHALGLVGYRLAAAAAAGPDEPGTDAPAPDAPERALLWQWTLGCLVAALHLPELWEETGRVTGRPLDETRIAAARTAFTERLREDLRVLDRAAGRSGDEVEAWTLRLGIEAHCADALARQELRISLPGVPVRRLVVGPTLERLLRADPDARMWGRQFDRAVRGWRRPDDAAGPGAPSRALDLFDDLGPYRYLLLRGRHGAAVEALEAVPDAARDDRWRGLLRQALIAQARDHHRHQDWREALECLTRAEALPDADPAGLPATGPAEAAELAAIAAESGLRAARALLKSRDDDQAGASDLLEQALALAPDHPEVRGDLGATYAQWARKINNEERDYVRSLALVRKALHLAPGDPTARHFLKAVLGNRANEVSDPTGSAADLAEATLLWRELAELDPDPDHRHGLAYVLRLRSRAAALAGRRTEALDLMTEALTADPEWHGDSGREAPRRVSVMLANHMLESMEDRPFDERAGVLRQAQTYDDSTDLRRLMVNVWNAEAAEDYNRKRYADAASLLEQALELARPDQDTARLREQLGVVYSSHAVDRANARQIPAARQLIDKAVQHNPRDNDLRALKRRIDALY